MEHVPIHQSIPIHEKQFHSTWLFVKDSGRLYIDIW